ncbi:MAG: ATP synthase F1 subunit delta, partial [Candidatus Binatia bacterium]
IEGRLSRRYARAIFQLAHEEHREEALGQEINRFVEAYDNSPLKTVLNNPAFGVQSRRNVAVQVAKSIGLTSLIIRFLSLLLERDRLDSLSSIAVHYHRYLDETKGRVQARVVSPTSLGEATLEKLRKILQTIRGKVVILKEETDPGLVGGVLIELEGKVYDGSIRTQLERMKESIGQGY